MPEAELFLLFARPLIRSGIRHLITGSVATVFYGEPRLTHDVDFIVYLSDHDMHKLAEAFPSPDFYLPPAEVLMIEAHREQRGHFSVIHMETAFKADFYLAGRDPLHAWAFRCAQRVEFQGETITLAPPEYVIIRKLEYYREGGSEKHVRDVRSILSGMGEKLDRATLLEFVQRSGLQAEWQAVSG